MPYVMTFGKTSERFTQTAASPAEVLALIRIKKEEGYEIMKIVDPDGIETEAHYLAYAISGVDVRSR